MERSGNGGQSDNLWIIGQGPPVTVEKVYDGIGEVLLKYAAIFTLAPDLRSGLQKDPQQ
ncbi:hypothetical protein ACONUD_10800 [Microbulbifer harenosus]|uniref:hypothetical protein n=1 Tax=Microbulbifer harenosus TaxID=2576840 RepID=UPI001484F42E|nr:hypothetical protein [Microbulbifer harenosus]